MFQMWGANGSTVNSRLLISFAACGVLWSAEANASCAANFKFEPDARLSVQAISRLGEIEVSPQNASGAMIVYQGFEIEDRPVRGEWAALGIVYATDAGLGVHPPGGVLWARKNLNLYEGGDQPRFARGRDGSLTLTISLPALVQACGRPYAFRLDKNDRLWANGMSVGVLRPEAP